MAKYQGKGFCDNCGSDTHVYTDKNGLAYYKCGPCGFKGTHSLMRVSQAFIDSKVEKFSSPDAVSEQAPVADAPVKKAGFFDGVLS